MVEIPRAVDGFRKQARRQREVVLPQRGVAAQVDDVHHEPGWIGEPPQARQRLLEHRHARLEVSLQDQFVRPVRPAHTEHSLVAVRRCHSGMASA